MFYLKLKKLKSTFVSDYGAQGIFNTLTKVFGFLKLTVMNHNRIFKLCQPPFCGFTVTTFFWSHETVSFSAGPTSDRLSDRLLELTFMIVYVMYTQYYRHVVVFRVQCRLELKQRTVQNQILPPLKLRNNMITVSKMPPPY